MTRIVSQFRGIKGKPHGAYLFSGFPGLYTRNEDLAETLAGKLGISTFTLELSGLGASLERFGLIESINEAARFVIDSVKALNLESYSLIGHSFGGLVCLNIMRINHLAPPERLILLSPVTSLPDRAAMERMIDEYAEVRNSVGAKFDAVSIKDELNAFFANFVPEGFVGALKDNGHRIRILQATNDTVVQPAQSVSFAQQVPESKLVLIKDNHWFSERSTTLLNILKVWD